MSHRSLRLIALATLLASSLGNAMAGGPILGGGKGSLRGTVLDAGGRPVPNAEVWVAAPARDTLLAKTDGAGVYALTGVAAGDVLVTVRAPRFDTWNGRATVPVGQPGTANVTLRAAGVILGRVVDARGAAIEGVRVRPIVSGRFPPASNYALLADPHIATVTDKEGRFLLDRMRPARTYRVRFQHPHYELQERSDAPTPGEAAPTEVVITLADAAWVSGVVLDADGKPVVGARVSGAPDFVWPEGEAEARTPIPDGRPAPEATVRTDPQGKFLLGSFPAGEATLSVRATGYLGEKTTLTLEGGRERSGVEIRLEKGFGTIEGTVVDAAGKPLPGAWVRQGRWLDEVDADTDKSGRFRLSPIPFRGTVTLGVCAYRYADVEDVAVEVGDKDVKVVMRPAPVWTGRITDEAGVVIPQVTVDVNRSDGTWHMVRRWGSASGGTYAQAEKGLAFYLPVRRASVRITAAGFASLDLGPYDTEPAATVEAGTVTLRRQGR